jgi:hypothetical protein
MQLLSPLICQCPHLSNEIRFSAQSSCCATVRPDAFVKRITQNEAKPIFCQNYYITFTVEISGPILWSFPVLFRKATQSKQSPKGRNFAQSGHPVVHLLVLIKLIDSLQRNENLKRCKSKKSKQIVIFTLRGIYATNYFCVVQNLLTLYYNSQCHTTPSDT